MAVQGPITFQDVAASFAEEQWMCLEDWQKEIYKTVVKEIHEAIISLGYTIINPNVVFSIKNRDESVVRVENWSAEKIAGTGDLPDILIQIKDEPSGEASCVTEKQADVARLSASGAAVTSVSSTSIREENTKQGQTHASSPPKKSNAFPIKTEEEACSIDQSNNAGGDIRPRPAEGDYLIKHESEEETDTEEDFQGRNGGVKPSTEDSTALEVEPKRRKVGFQVRGDILSLQEREVRRVRVLEGVVKPFQAQSRFAFDPHKHEDVKTERPELPDRRRRDISNTNWCKCGHCCVMSTTEESICCHEIFGLLSQMNDERLCITKHPAFQELCLDRDRLDFLYRFLARIKRKNDVLYYLHKLRRTSYRAFVIWAHSFLDYRKHKPIPACVVKQVQEFLPYPEELNVGYMKMYDYPAALMALDHI